METVFLKLLNMSITASYLALAVAALRLLLKRAPKRVSVFLWALVGIRLLCPFSLESIFSLIPSAETVPTDILYSKTPEIHSGIWVLNTVVNPILSETMAPTVGSSVNPMQTLVLISSILWIAGMAAVLLYAAVSYLKIYAKVREATPLQGNVWICDRIASPFILGILRPRIYLPSDMDAQDAEFVVAHEKAHLKRRDHWWKPLGFALLTVYWFNPVLWLAYILLCRDIELACDEKVLRDLGSEIKKPYSDALINCSVKSRMLTACPLAFGEIGVKGRIKSVLSYKKPAFWIVAAAVLVCVLVGICFLTNPATADPEAPAPQWPPLADTRENYSPEQAAADGCVVIESSTLLAGEKLWIDFVNTSAAGQPAAVRIYQAYTDSYVVKELRYNGEKYLLAYYDHDGDTGKEFLHQEKYQYLIRSPYQVDNGFASSFTDDYLLADSPDVTAEGLFNSIVSSVARPEYAIYNHCWWIYSVSTTPAYFLDSFYGIAFAELDGDGQAEKYCLGMGPTSGLFTFTLSVYAGDTVMQQVTYCTEFSDLRFTQDYEGKLMVQCTTHGGNPETHLFHIVWQDGHLELKEDGQSDFLQRWGDSQ